MNGNFPVSIKGIIYDENNRILLLQNERDEWELPGGRIELDENPKETLVREVFEELDIKCEIDKILESYLLEVIPNKYVFIVVYLCKQYKNGIIKISDEHKEFGWFKLNELNDMKIPSMYKESINKALKTNG
jgi:mutator protein MutT